MKNIFNTAKISIAIACMIPVATLGGYTYHQYDKSKKLTSVLAKDTEYKITENLVIEDIQGVMRFYQEDPNLFANYIIELQQDSVAYRNLLQEQSRKLISQYPNTTVSQLHHMVQNIQKPERAFSEKDSDFHIRNTRMYMDMLQTTNTSLAIARLAASSKNMPNNQK
ncbi:MAG: hypothetical protein NC311_00150 [Muribaculaceae bacterium]|nr:hypothetical protein [Muribaculaceae bacterium]